MKLGPLLRDARRQKGWSLRDAACQIGIGYGHLCELENDNRQSNPTVKTLCKFNKHYGIPLYALLDAAVETMRSKK